MIQKYDYIKYIPPTSKYELLDIYQDNDIFVMPSITETFGLVYPEAMSQGLPVIYSRGQGFDGQFEDGEIGYSVDCFDANEIADKITKVYENYSEISSNCTKLLNKFNWVNISKQYEILYSLTINQYGNKG